MSENLIEVSNLTKTFPVKQKMFSRLSFQGGKVGQAHKSIHAVTDVNFSIKKGEVFSIVGESGCGKSTTARTLIRLHEPDAGTIKFGGVDISHLDEQSMQPFRRRMQMIFQNPYSSLNPRHTVKNIIAEPILFHHLAKNKKDAEEQALCLLDKVGLQQEQADRYPHQFSGGQRQRISIARALAVSPDFIIADEPVSALDVSIQAQILNLLLDIKDEYNLSYLFIAHNLAVVKHISDRVAVMYLGRIVEVASKNIIFNNPLHPYTKALFASIPVLGQKIKDPGITGDTPSNLIELSTGCCFYRRCAFAQPVCRELVPEFKEYETGHQVACHFVAKGGVCNGIERKN